MATISKKQLEKVITHLHSVAVLGYSTLHLVSEHRDPVGNHIIYFKDKRRLLRKYPNSRVKIVKHMIRPTKYNSELVRPLIEVSQRTIRTGDTIYYVEYYSSDNVKHGFCFHSMSSVYDFFRSNF